jgi:hypothetical protein
MENIQNAQTSLQHVLNADGLVTSWTDARLAVGSWSSLGSSLQPISAKASKASEYGEVAWPPLQEHLILGGNSSSCTDIPSVF